MEKIYLVPVAGLANRIRSINSTLELGKKLSKNITILWFQDALLHSSFNALFEPVPGVTVFEEPIKKRFLWIEYYYQNGRDKVLSYIFQKFYFKKVFFKDDLREGLYAAKISPDQLERTLANAKRSLIFTDFSFYPASKNYLQPNADVAGQVQEFIGSTSEHLIGLHIRRTDHTIAIENSNDDMFVKKIQSELTIEPEAIFFLATDSEAVKNTLKNKFGAKIITFESTLDRNSPEGIKHALIELLILSKTKKIIGSLGSSFSEIASFIGNNPLTYP